MPPAPRCGERGAGPRASATVGRVTRYLPGPTALLGERLRSALRGYSVALSTHPALDSPAPAGAGRARAVVVVISEPELELVAWVSEGDLDAEPWSDRVVELRIVLSASAGDGDEEFGPTGPGAADERLDIAAMVGESIGFDSVGSDDLDLPLEDVLDAVWLLVTEELPVEVADTEFPVQRAYLEAMRVYLNDPIGRPQSG
jgi:hypothetical protein